MSYLRVSDRSMFGTRIGEFRDLSGLQYGLIGYFSYNLGKYEGPIARLITNLAAGTPIYRECEELGIRVVRVLSE